MWLYKGKELTEDEIPDKAAGFIYIITHKTTGRKYCGRKLLTKAHTRQKNKKKIRTRVESDWKTYWSSSPELLEQIERDGTDNFVREVLVFAFNKAQLMYLEERFLYTVGAMESEMWINSNIRARIFKRNILGKIDSNEINDCLKKLLFF